MEVTKNDRKQKKILQIKNKELLSLLLGRKGGKTTMRILDELLKRPNNANQLSNLLGVDYNTITFHINILLEKNYVDRIEVGSTIIFYPSDKLIKSYDEYLIIKETFKND